MVIPSKTPAISIKIAAIPLLTICFILISGFQSEKPVIHLETKLAEYDCSKEMQDTLKKEWEAFSKTFLHITTSPNSPTMTINFAHNPLFPDRIYYRSPGEPWRWPTEWWYPLDVSVEFYFNDNLITTIPFQQSTGTETITADFFQREGIWKAIAKLDPKWKSHYPIRSFETTFVVKK